MSVRTGALLLALILAAWSLWCAVKTDLYAPIGFVYARAPMVVAGLSVLAVCVSWAMDSQKDSF
ncbi:MAG: hypothetical protein LC135_07065 [Phycisphaerae bacterium]|nr:hypothetical protein [Phycisphaerae bacterium]MCZ2399614.1 hypothetical protein [Phycisphaerae bacterium]NUQ49817.1 hypothetical protein [Phycisphaerae bacterium]